MSVVSSRMPVQSFAVISVNVTINHTLLNTRFFALDFCRRRYTLTSITLTRLAPKPLRSSRSSSNKGADSPARWSSNIAPRLFDVEDFGMPTNRKSVWDRLSVNTTYIKSIMHGFQVIADSGIQRYTALFNAFVRDEYLKSRLRNFWHEETSNIAIVWCVSDC